jgi:hypothetical protein
MFALFSIEGKMGGPVIKHGDCTLGQSLRDEQTAPNEFDFTLDEDVY